MCKSILASMAILALGASAYAQGVPAELASQPQTTRFLVMPATGNSCTVGVFKSGGRMGPWCSVSISECVAAHGVISRDFRGNWVCKP